MINTIKATINLTNVCLDEVDLGNGVIYRGDDLATTLEIKAPINSNAYVLLACITPNGRNLGPFNADNTTSSSTTTTYEFLLTKENGYNFAVGRTELIVYYCVVNTNSSISKKAIGSICVDVKKGVSVDDEATFIIGDTTDADAVLTDLNTKIDNLINQVASYSTQLSNKLDAVKNTVTLTNSGVLFTSRVESGTDYTVQSQGRNGISSIVDSSTADNTENRTATTTTRTISDKNSSNSTETKQTANYVTLKATDGTNTNVLSIAPQSVNINGVDVVVEDDLTAEATARQNADGTLQTNIDNEALARSSADTILQANIDASGHKIEVLKDLSTYQYTFVLFDANDNVLSSQLIDLPIESMIINVSYDATNKDLIITLQNGTTLNVPLDDIVSGLASQDWVTTQLSTKANASTTYTKSEVDTKLTASKNYTDNIYTLATNNIAGKDTSANILAKSSNSGIWVGTDTGHWYYWNGTQYADGGVYLSEAETLYLVANVYSTSILSDCNEAVKNGVYLISSDVANRPVNEGGTLLSYSYSNNYKTQLYSTLSGSLYHRQANNGVWSTWKLVLTGIVGKNLVNNDILAISKSVSSTTDLSNLDNAEENRIYYINAINIPNQPVSLGGLLICFAYYNLRTQFYISEDNKMYYRYRDAYAYKDWIEIANNQNLTDIYQMFGNVHNDITYVNGYFINSWNGGIRESAQFKYSNPILINNKCDIWIKAKGYSTNISILSKTDVNGTTHTPLIRSTDNVYKWYKYHITESGYYCVCGNNSNDIIFITHDDNATVDIETSSISLFENVGVIGDSYASGVIFTDYDTSYTNYNLSWGQMMARRNGINLYNYSYGGATTRTFITENNRGLPKILNDDPKNLYLLFLGINDRYSLGMDYLGSMSDINDSDPSLNADTFYGNYGRIIANIKTHAPNSKIIISTLAKNSESSFVAFNNAIIEMANHFNIPVIYQYDNDYFKSSRYLDTMIGGHPTGVGYGEMSKALEKMINECISTNRSYFNNYIG